MILQDSEIRRLSREGLISPYKDENLQPASYDVTLGHKFLSFHPSNDYHQAYIDAASGRILCGSYAEVDNGPEACYILQPNEFILGHTIESVKVPNNLAARFEGKSSLGRLGLATHITAGFIDPGFQGQITVEIKNENSLAIVLTPGMKIGQICFMQMLEEPKRPYGSDFLGSHYQGQMGPTRSARRG